MQVLTLGLCLTCPLGSSPPPLEMGLPVLYIQELSPQLLYLNFSSSLPEFFQCNSAREQLSGGGLPSLANLKGFLALIRAGVFQKHLAPTLGLILCFEVSYINELVLLLSDEAISRQTKNFQAVWKTLVVPDGFSTWADRYSARQNGLKGEAGFPWETVASDCKSRTFWPLFNTIYLGRSEFSQVSCQLVALRSSLV